MSRLPAKYSQSVTAIDLERMILIVAPLYSRLPVLSTQVADLPVAELSHQAYRNSDWYGKIASFLLDGPTALDDLSHTEKRAVKRTSIKYRVTDQHLLYIERGGETAKCPLPFKIPSILKWAHDEHGHFSSQLTLHKIRGQWYWPTRVSDVEQFCRTCKTCQLDGPRRISTNFRPILSFKPWAMVGMDWIGPISPPCVVTGWRYILVVVDYFSRFVWARGYGVANQEAVHDSWLNFLVPVFGFPLCLFHDNGSHFTGAEITAFFELHGTTQIRAPISHPSSVGLVERNVQLVISQVRKWVLDRGPGAKTIWGRSIPEIIPSINGRLVRLHGFTPSEIMLGYVPEWKVTGSETPIREVTSEEIEELEKGADGLIIERMVERREEQRTFAVRSISENHTRQEKKTRAQWTKPQVGDLVLVRDFERDKHHGRKLDARWLGPRILTEITSSGVSGFVQELYGEEVKKYHLDDLKTYCPRAENSPTTTSITRTAMSLAGFPGQRAITLHSLFSDCQDYN